jgi:hypothetical protein
VGGRRNCKLLRRKEPIYPDPTNLNHIFYKSKIGYPITQPLPPVEIAQYRNHLCRYSSAPHSINQCCGAASFLCGSGSGAALRYGSGSGSGSDQKMRLLAAPAPAPQHCYQLYSISAATTQYFAFTQFSFQNGV